MYLYLMFSFLTIASFITVLSNKKYNTFAKVVFVIFIVILLLQLTVGPDFIAYMDWYSEVNIKSINFMNFSNLLNLNFNALINLNKFLGGNYVTFKLMVNAISLTFVFYVIYKKSDNIMLSLFLFIASGIYIFYYCSGLRQMIAMSLFLYGYYLMLTEGKYWKYLIIIIVATLFHYSALITVILIPFHKYYDNITNNYKQYLIGALIVSLIILFGFNIFHKGLYSWYLETGNWLFYWTYYTQSFTLDIIGIILRTTLVILDIILLLCVSKDKRSKNDYFFIITIIVSYLIYLSMSGFSVFGRIYDFIAIIEFIAIPCLIMKIDRQFWKITMLSSIVAINFIMFAVDIRFVLSVSPYDGTSIAEMHYYSIFQSNQLLTDLEISE